jgi:hypothetical protein
VPQNAFDTRNYLLNGKPTALLAESFPRDQISTDLVASLVTQVMTSVALPLVQGDRVTNLSFLSGATAASVPTNWWFALYDASGALLQQSADQLTAAWAADAVKTLALASPVVIPVDGIYYAAIMVKATTVPTLMGKTTARAAAAGAVDSRQKVLAQNSGSGLTTTAPATIASPTTQAVVPYCVAS